MPGYSSTPDLFSGQNKVGQCFDVIVKYIYFMRLSVCFAAVMSSDIKILSLSFGINTLREAPRGSVAAVGALPSPGLQKALVGGFYMAECSALKYFATREDTLEFSEAEHGIT